VIGASFRVGTLARAAGMAPEAVLELLDEASRRGLVRPVADAFDAYAFSHGLVQATLYEALPRGRRCALHEPVGEALERDYDVAAGEGLAEIAYHFLEAAPAGNRERAVAYARRAAERAVQTFAYEEAVTLYSRALEIVGPDDARERLGLLLALGEAQMRAGDAVASRQTLERAAEAARTHDDPEALARAALACNIWGLSSGIDEALVRLGEEAVERLEGRGFPGLLASVKGLLAAALYWSDQVERRERLAEDALALARSEHELAPTRESARVLAFVLGRYLLTRWGPDSGSVDFKLSDELIALSRETRDSELEILARNWRITVLLEMGSFPAVDREIARVEQMATDLRQARAMVFLPLHHAIRAGMEGRFKDAERLNAESVETGLRVRGTVGELAAGAQLVAIRLQEGRLAEVESAVRIVANMHPGMVGFQCALALALVQSGRMTEARAELERLTSSGREGIPRDNTHIIMLALLGEVAAELKDEGRSRDLYAWLEPYSGRWVTSPGAAALWPVDRSLGRIATVAGLHEAALRHIERGREQAARAGAAPSLALAALDEARLLAARPPQDWARVAALAREARELAQDLGMGLVVDAATLLEASD
jgi:tetratricopeptide (TPR) repeat protein